MFSGRHGALCALLLALSGCGFALQGAYTLPGGMQKTWISTDDRYSPFYRSLRQELARTGIAVLDAPVDDAAVLRIVTEETGQRVLSVSARNVPTEYEVYYTVEYNVTSGDKTLKQRQRLTVTQDYTYDENRVLGKAAEEAMLREALVDDLVRIIVKQLDSL